MEPSTLAEAEADAGSSLSSAPSLFLYFFWVIFLSFPGSLLG